MSTFITAQNHFRIKADFTIKETLSSGEMRLTTGVVSYDKEINKLIYRIEFPEASTVIIQDSVLTSIAADGTSTKSVNYQDNRFSIFAMCLQGKLGDFGLKAMNFSLTDVEKENELVISSYQPPKLLDKFMGEVVISHKKKRLNGVIFFHPDGTLKGKQFFRDYQQIGHLLFPSKMIQVVTKEEQEFYKVTEFSNIVVNEEGANEFYDLSINN